MTSARESKPTKSRAAFRYAKAGIALLAAALVVAGPQFRAALPGYKYEFPRDHFEHPEFRTEWWYYTGNLQSAEGHRFGFQLVFFRQAERRGPSANQSAWRVDDLYLAHAALTDIDGKRFAYHKRLNRAGPGIAGASFDRRRIWNGNWSSAWSERGQRVAVTTPDFRMTLDLRPLTPPVIHGLHGVSQKAPGPGQASHYVSFPGMQATGEVSSGGRRHQVKGLAWMDHEWFTHQLAADQAGWDWFSIQLDDGRALMLFQLRRKDGSIDRHSAGTYIESSGASRHLGDAQFRLMPLGFWTSPKSGARYPVRWRVEVPGHKLRLECKTVLDAQELVSEDKTGPTYWEGAVVYTGDASGTGYLEMTGYDKPVMLN